MIASLLIGIIGFTDLARTRSWRGSGWIYLGVLWVGFLAFAVLGLSVHPLVAVVMVALAAGWVRLMPAADADRPRQLWPAIGVGVLVLAAALSGDAWPVAGASSSPVADAYRSADGILSGVPLEVLVACVAVAVFLVSSSNIVTRAALGRAAMTTPLSTDRRTVWELRIRGRMLGEMSGQERAVAPATFLQGGRLIGPVERLLIVILALLGAYVLIGALVAAKGVVRFPEISADRGVGSKAEEFLVGSLTSWSLATAGALYLAAVIHL